LRSLRRKWGLIFEVFANKEHAIDYHRNQFEANNKNTYSVARNKRPDAYPASLKRRRVVEEEDDLGDFIVNDEEESGKHPWKYSFRLKIC